MARGTDFGGVHSHRDLHLIQASVVVAPAKPKTNFIDIPGADGSKDFSESPAGRVVFGTREITWTFKLYPGDDWATKYAQVSNAINGRACKITLDNDPNYYYLGRVSVEEHAVDGIMHTITVLATCQPFKLWQVETKVTDALTTTYKTLLLRNDRKPVVPTITLTAAATLLWNGNTFSLAAGTHKILDIMLVGGPNYLQAKTTTGTGTITVTYQEGAL
jgi:hypothetical protein